MFIAKYNQHGTLTWAKCVTVSVGATNIISLSDNSTVMTGYFQNLATFGKYEPNETTLSTDGTFDIFIARFNTDGTLDWAKKASGPGWNISHGIGPNSDNSVIITGGFSYTITFDEGEPTVTELTSAGSGHCCPK